MKNIFITSLLVLIGLTAVSQSSCVPDQRIYDKYSKERVNFWLENSKKEICLRNFELTNGYDIITADNDKLPGMEQLKFYNYKEKKYEGNVAQIDISNFNLYNYMYERHYSQRNYYRIGNTDQVLVIPPQKSFTKKFNEYYEKLNQ